MSDDETKNDQSEPSTDEQTDQSAADAEETSADQTSEDASTEPQGDNEADEGEQQAAESADEDQADEDDRFDLELEEKYLSKMFEVEDSTSISTYEDHGGYRSLEKVVEMSREEVIDEMKTSNLRGRGGAGFPAGIKWSFLPGETDDPKYMVVNADEGEPGTFKDRQIMEKDPHLMIEGCIATALALGIRYCYIYVRGELQNATRIIDDAIEEAYEAGYLGEDVLGSGKDLDMYTHISAGAYICGEETGMIEGLEGKPGKPRIKPPFPAVVGVFDSPTLVNNVETLACVPSIINNGGDWFARVGCEKNGGPKLYGLSGPINNPGVYEAPSGITVGELLEEYGGGMRDGHELKAYIPGGSSTNVMMPDDLDLEMSFEVMREHGTNVGTGCITFLDQNTCMVRLAARLAHFYHHESCGQCTPCRDGTGWAAKILDAIEAGRGRTEDLDLLYDMTGNIEDNTICALGPSLTYVVHSYLDKFREDFEAHIEQGECPYPSWGKESTASNPDHQREAAPVA